jgi:hypothetical protein
MKIETVKMIRSSEWDKLVRKTYGRPYCFQQQDGCKHPNIALPFKVPSSADECDFENDSIPEDFDTDEMGVSFSAWLQKDINLPKAEKWEREIWWERNFYPDFQMVANDLYKKGLLPKGEYYMYIE